MIVPKRSVSCVATVASVCVTVLKIRYGTVAVPSVRVTVSASDRLMTKIRYGCVSVLVPQPYLGRGSFGKLTVTIQTQAQYGSAPSKSEYSNRGAHCMAQLQQRACSTLLYESLSLAKPQLLRLLFGATLCFLTPFPHLSRHIMNELIETERVYVNELKLIIDVSVGPFELLFAIAKG